MNELLIFFLGGGVEYKNHLSISGLIFPDSPILRLQMNPKKIRAIGPLPLLGTKHKYFSGRFIPTILEKEAYTLIIGRQGQLSVNDF